MGNDVGIFIRENGVPWIRGGQSCAVICLWFSIIDWRERKIDRNVRSVMFLSTFCISMGVLPDASFF
jgi:hypothetical protein